MRKWIGLVLVLLMLPVIGRAGDGDVRLNAGQALIDSGLLKHLLPRFSLKTQVRINLVEGEADMILSPEAEGVPVFSGAGATWRIAIPAGHPGAERFAEWLTSDVGQRTVTGFTVEGVQPFTLPEAVAKVVVEESFEGDAAEGLKLSNVHCGRCHVVSEANRMNAIGSTPSFFVLRTLGDWDNRFRAFYALNPHPSFTQIEDVTEPFPFNRPPPISPLEMTLEDLDAILAYVSRLQPADLGDPIKHQ